MKTVFMGAFLLFMYVILHFQGTQRNEIQIIIPRSNIILNGTNQKTPNSKTTLFACIIQNKQG